MKNRLLYLLLFLGFTSYTAFAQVPITNIYLLDIKIKDNKYEFTNAEKINDQGGYNNQPYFTPNSKSIYYVSYRNKQADIYKYDIKSKITEQFTNTPEDEYSPKVTPDGKYISVVRVMKDSSQQLWKFPIKGGLALNILKPEKGYDSIGYYCWHGDDIVMANVPEPMKLSMAHWGKFEPLSAYYWGNNYKFLKNVGRTILIGTDRKKEVYFIQKPADKKDSINWICKLYENDSLGKFQKIIKTFPNCEDFAFGTQNVIFMGCKGKLYKYAIGKDAEWKEVADFTNQPYKNFYRIVINKTGDKIAIVSK